MEVVNVTDVSCLGDSAGIPMEGAATWVTVTFRARRDLMLC